MATFDSLEIELSRLESRLQLFEDSIEVIELSVKRNGKLNPYFPELQATFKRLVENAKENEEYQKKKEEERQKELMARVEKEMQEMKKLLQEMEEENRKLKEKEEKQALGREVLDYLINGGSSNEEVLKVMEEVQIAYEKCERYLDPERQKRVIRDVERLKEYMTSGMTVRNVAGGVSLSSSVLTVILSSHPVGRAISGAVAASSFAFYLAKRKDIEITWKRIDRFLSDDAERFKSLARAIEELDQFWQSKFSFSIYSERFREICNTFSDTNKVVTSSCLKGNEDPLSLFPEKKLREALIWLGNNTVWKNIKDITASHYFFSTISIISNFCDNPALQICVPGFFAVCQIFLLVQDYSSDQSKLAAVDQGLKRMKEQCIVMEEFMRTTSA